MHPAPEESWYLLESGARPAAENMAWDQVLLETAPELARPVFRFYGWTEPAATFGYFQKYAEIERLTPLRPLVRRPTGGGLVPHDADWTYSLVFPPAASWYSLKAVESYRRVHEWIQAAFARAGLQTRLAPCARKEVVGQCFIGAEQFDLLWKHRKIAGAAQRRTRQGLLIQGSIQPPAGMDREAWLKCFCAIGSELWGIQWSPFAQAPELELRVQRLAAEKYGTVEYNRRK